MTIKILLLLLLAVLPSYSYFRDGACPTIVGCLSCPDPAVCTKCDSTQKFDSTPVEGKCICLNGFYLSRLTCIACENSHPYCLTCSQDGKICNTCMDGYFQDKGSCASCGNNCISCKSAAACDKCKDGSLWDGKVCRDCNVTNCLTCSKVNLCTKCMNTFYLKHHTSPLAKNYTC